MPAKKKDDDKLIWLLLLGAGAYWLVKSSGASAAPSAGMVTDTGVPVPDLGPAAPFTPLPPNAITPPAVPGTVVYSPTPLNNIGFGPGETYNPSGSTATTQPATQPVPLTNIAATVQSMAITALTARYPNLTNYPNIISQLITIVNQILSNYPTDAITPTLIQNAINTAITQAINTSTGYPLGSTGSGSTSTGSGGSTSTGSGSTSTGSTGSTGSITGSTSTGSITPYTGGGGIVHGGGGYGSLTHIV